MIDKNLNNRLHNTTNPYQGTAKKVLCLCSAGLLRSPTAANVLHQEFGYNTRAAGTSTDFALIPVDQVLVHWADEIICMSMEQVNYINAVYSNSIGDKPVISLDIPDNYQYNDPELKDIIKLAYQQELKIISLKP